jgi:hypothetical protein
MKLVIDTNQLRECSLKDFLVRSAKNKAVLIDYCAIEIYKPGAIEAVNNSLSILKHFGDQVVILKGTMAICGQRGRKAGLQRRLIDDAQTAGFQQFVIDVDAANAGDMSRRRAVAEHFESATLHMNRVLPDVGTLIDVMPTLAAKFSNEERALLKFGIFNSTSTIKKILTDVFEISAYTFANHPTVKKWPKIDELPYTFIFRLTLATYLMALERLLSGALPNLKHERLRNDMIDMYFVAYGTFFDGVLSSDKRVNKTYKQVTSFLQTVLTTY